MKQDNKVNRTLDSPLEYPAELLKSRFHRTEYLYTVVDGAQHLDECDNGTLDVFTKAGIEAHLSRKKDCNLNGLVSTYEDEKIALKRGKGENSVKLILRTSGLVPAWLTTGDIKIPIWVSQKTEGSPRVKHAQPNVWICLDEAKVVLDIPDHLCDKGEWLVHGHSIKQRAAERIATQHSRIPKRNTDVEAYGVFDDEEREGQDKRSNREQHHLVEDKHTENPSTKDTSYFLEEPCIPTRKSSLRSLKPKPSNPPPTATTQSPQLRLATRNATITLTNADQSHAASLMKYALLMAYGKKPEAEETWPLDTSSISSLSSPGARSENEDGEKQVWCENLEVNIDVDMQSEVSTTTSSSPHHYYYCSIRV